MEGLKRYLFHITFLLVLAISMFFMLPSDVKNHNLYINDGWEVYYNGINYDLNDLPKHIDSAKEISFKKKVDRVENNSVLAFQTIQSEAYIYADNKLIYEYKSPVKFSKTPGNKVHQIELPESQEEHQIEVVIKPVYGTDKFTNPNFIIGHVATVGRHYISKSILSFVLSAILFVLGICVCGAWLVIHRKVKIKEDLLWLGLFAVSISCWLMLETQLVSQVFGNSLFWTWMTFLSLKTSINPITKYVETLYGGESKVFYYVRMASSFDIVCSIVLQLLGIFDFSETLFITHLIFIFGVVCGVYLGARNLNRNVAKKNLTQFHSYSLIVVCLMVFADIACYYRMPSVDSARFTRVGLLLYTVVLGGYALLDTISLLKNQERTEILSELALIDSMTKLKNRNAFEEMISKMDSATYLNKGVIIFDLNDLKYFNDTYGHSMGDYYIIVASEIILELFGMYGTIYRVGGDEFCAIVENVSLNKFIELRKILNDRLESLHGNRFEGKMVVAVGYAEFDGELDINLQSTMKRADQDMYSNKELLKAQ